MNKYPFKIFILAICFSVHMGCAVQQKQPAPVPAATTQEVPENVVTVPIPQTSRGTYKPERTKVFDLVHTKLEVRFDWQKQHLLGLATVVLKPWFYPQQKLELDARGFDIHSVNIIRDNQPLKVEYTYDGEVLAIQLDKIYNHSEELTVEIDYTAKPNELAVGGSAAITSDKGLYFINPLGEDPNKPRQIWTQGETQANSAWFPTIDSPNQRCTQEMYMTVDTNFVTLSNGTLIYSRANSDGTRTDYWEQKLPHAPYLFMMAVGEHAVVKDSWNGMEVNYYVEPKYAPYAKAIFGNTPEMLTFFSDKLGVKYPWAKYSQIVVRDFVSGAMENTTASVFMEALQADSRELLDNHWDGIIAHELFHHWFGDLVTSESWANLPLNESFANYSEYLWAEYKYGRDEADYLGLNEEMQYLDEAQSKQEPLIRYYYEDRENMFDSHSYAKGGRVLHMLRKYVGDEAFFASLNLYLNKNKFEDVEIHNLRLAFEEVTGEDLNWFFNQWFLNPGHPVLRVKHSYNEGTLHVNVWQEQDSLATPIYKLPLTLETWSGDNKTLTPITVTKSYQEFSIPLEQKPDMVLFDAEQQLLGVVQHQKTQTELVNQYKKSDKFLARFKAIDSLGVHVGSPEIEQLIFSALNDSSWVIRELALSVFATHAPSEFGNVRDKIIALTTDDPKSSVRATAIQVLANFPADANIEVYEYALNDSSYMVTAAALDAIVINGDNAEEKERLVNQFRSSNNKDIISVVADYYAEQAKEENYAWFVERLEESGAEVKYFTIQNFGKYLLKLQDIEIKRQGAKLLESIAKDDSSYYVKFSAYQALSLLEDLPEVKQMRQQIKANEKDIKLKRLYDMIP
jgi:aminopeptidase N